MNRFNFSNIHNASWLNVSILAENIETAIKKFNAMWGSNVKYSVTTGEPHRAMQVMI